MAGYQTNASEHSRESSLNLQASLHFILKGRGFVCCSQVSPTSLSITCLKQIGGLFAFVLCIWGFVFLGFWGSFGVWVFFLFGCFCFWVFFWWGGRGS